MELTEYKWVAVVGGMACTMVGFGIGANDVANNFGTSVGSKAITLAWALLVAGVFEFVGAVGFGSSVTDSVKGNIFDLDLFVDMPDVLMYGYLCSLMASAFWLIFASTKGLPVSTTHSMIGSLCGVGLAISASAVGWRYFLDVLIAWIVSPLLSAVFGGLFFTAVKFGIMRRNSALRILRFLLPVLLFALGCVFTTYFLLKAPLEIKVSCHIPGKVEAINPCILKKWIKGNYGYGALIVIVSAVIIMAVFTPIIQWTSNKKIKRFDEEEINGSPLKSSSKSDDVESSVIQVAMIDSSALEKLYGTRSNMSHSSETGTEKATPEIQGRELRKRRNSENEKPVSWSRHPWLACNVMLQRQLQNLPWKQDLHQDVLMDDEIQDIHDKCENFDPRAEVYFGGLQIVSACVSCIVHGSNDVANAVAPFAGILGIYNHGVVDSKVDVPIWALALGGAGIVVGLSILGHHVIKKIGIELMKITPSRGFSIEMGMTTVVMIATVIGLPVSATHCQIGSSIGVALADKPMSGRKSKYLWLNWGAIHWPLMTKVALSWIFTLIFTAMISCAVFSFSIYGPTRNPYYSYDPKEVPWGF